ncbi:hypothetical protein [Thauera linaloolentis]|uniref:Uncharacterized protein n=1 Tax=Thauera linaloolentis (strain DSM 12138 / JCM 21573 / CCUG 41526 / CIP 105981 / IAM 15112 / NBRC 102519 / 47Lol) TaxID=1123367 RepID=N6YPA1_THAL4|nr:hypothetical protein [Thauera linaloolentis]ENO84008.1 hypothetical protein C666_18070 [Thauera linaloolentis 47Lol = DSM 12138]MCM8565809.1 hypothetical protein [Thauera linaloolentis]
MRFVVGLVFLVSSLDLVAQPYLRDEIEFRQGGELLSWCQSEAQAYFVGKGIPTYQWSARHYERGNVLFVEGSIRANGSDVPVTCRVAKGARERHAIVEVHNTP